MKKLIISTIAIIISGCAFAPVDTPPIDKYSPKKSMLYINGATVEQGMDVARSALQSSGYEIHSFTPELGEVRTKNRLIQVPELCDCGTWNSSVVQGSADSNIVIIVKNDGDNRISLSAEHQCTNTFYGRNLYNQITVQQPLKCASRGTIEREFFEKIDAIASARKYKTNKQ